MRMFPLHNHSTKLKCPYEGCRKTFDKPTVLIDSSSIPRQTCYVCPFCMSKIDVLTEDMKIVGVKATQYPRVFESPAKCANYSGMLSLFPDNDIIPDECLACPKVLQCSARNGCTNH